MAQNAMKLVYGVSLAVHLGGGAALVAFEEHRPPPPTVVEMRTVESRPKPAAEAPPPPPPPPPRERAPRAARPAPPAPAEAPPPTEAPPPSAAADVPDFGFALSGVSAGGGPGGIAVPVGNGGRAPAPVRQQTARTLTAATPAAHVATGECEEAEVRAAPLGQLRKPAYTDDAREAQIEGRVRVEITVDENGHVTDVHVIGSLGHGLDEAAIAAAREAAFTPATRCGRPVASTVRTSFIFTLGV